MLETFRVWPLWNNLTCPLWKRMGYKKLKSAGGIPLAGSLTGRPHCMEKRLGHAQGGTGIRPSRGFSRRYVPGEDCLGCRLWGTWYEGQIPLLVVPTTTPGQVLLIRPLTAVQPAFLGHSVPPLAHSAEFSWSNPALTIALSRSTTPIDDSCLLTVKLLSLGPSRGSTHWPHPSCREGLCRRALDTLVQLKPRIMN